MKIFKPSKKKKKKSNVRINRPRLVKFVSFFRSAYSWSWNKIKMLHNSILFGILHQEVKISDINIKDSNYLTFWTYSATCAIRHLSFPTSCDIQQNFMAQCLLTKINSEYSDNCAIRHLSFPTSCDIQQKFMPNVC